MEDKAYSLPLLPISMAALTVDDANSIEKNLRYLLCLLPMFDAAVSLESIGSLGYLQLDEIGNAGDGFDIDTAVGINRITIFVEGKDLSALSWSGEGWKTERESATEILVVCTTDGFWDAAEIQQALSSLCFTATDSMDVTITLIAECEGVMAFTALGPVMLRFRSGATWALLETLGTWSDLESTAATWAEIESLQKEDCV